MKLKASYLVLVGLLCLTPVSAQSIVQQVSAIFYLPLSPAYTTSAFAIDQKVHFNFTRFTQKYSGPSGLYDFNTSSTKFINFSGTPSLKLNLTYNYTSTCFIRYTIFNNYNNRGSANGQMLWSGANTTKDRYGAEITGAGNGFTTNLSFSQYNGGFTTVMGQYTEDLKTCHRAVKIWNGTGKYMVGWLDGARMATASPLNISSGSTQGLFIGAKGDAGLPSNLTIWDIGCGAGNFTANLTAFWNEPCPFVSQDACFAGFGP